MGWGRVSQPGGENPEPLTLRGAHTGHLVLGVGDSELLQLLWGEGILQVPVTPLLPSLAVNPTVPARPSEGLQSGPSGGGSPGRAGVSRADAQGSQGGWMWGKRRGCGSQGFVWRNSVLGACTHTWVMHVHRPRCRFNLRGELAKGQVHCGASELPPHTVATLQELPGPRAQPNLSL